MTRRRRRPVDSEEVRDEARRARLEYWRRRFGGPEVPDPDAPHVGDPDGPMLLSGRAPGMAGGPLPEGSEYVRGTGAWRQQPGMPEYLDFLRRERARRGLS